MKKLILWSIQSFSAWEKLNKEGVLRGQLATIMEPDWQAEYDWIREQMVKRIPGCEAKEYPIWAWLNHRPDLRKERFCVELGEKAVLLKLEIEPERLLLSDFSAWHYVLNRMYSSFEDEEESNYWENKLKKELGVDYCCYDKLPSQLKQEVRDSWVKIFDLKRMQAKPRKNEYRTQAVFENLYLADVVSHQIFQGEWVAKPPKIAIK